MILEQFGIDQHKHRFMSVSVAVLENIAVKTRHFPMYFLGRPCVNFVVLGARDSSVSFVLLEGFVVTMYEGVCEQKVPIPRP